MDFGVPLGAGRLPQVLPKPSGGTTNAPGGIPNLQKVGVGRSRGSYLPPSMLHAATGIITGYPKATSGDDFKGFGKDFGVIFVRFRERFWHGFVCCFRSWCSLGDSGGVRCS